MATLVHLDTSTEIRAIEIALAINKMREGLALLDKYDGVRAQTIAVSQATFGAAFGIADAGEAQAFNDRWAAISAGSYAGLSDFLDATLDGPGSGAS